MKMFQISCFLLLLCFFQWACTKPLTSGSSGQNTPQKIYLAGVDDAGYPVLFEKEANIKIDTIGKKGVVPRDLFIVGTDTYLTTQGGYWKNGVWVDLYKTCEKVDASTTLFKPYVKNNDVYIGGSKKSQLGNTIDTIRIWKNGKIIYQMTAPKLDFYGGPTVDDMGNVYYNTRKVTNSGGSFGSFWNTWYESLQKNNIEIWNGIYTSSQSASFQAFRIEHIITKGINVYSMLKKIQYKGVEYQGLSINWLKNFSSNYFASFSPLVSFALTGVYEYNDTLYTAGMEQHIYVKGKIWRNSEEQVLFDVPNSFSPYMGNVVVFNGDVYVAGNDGTNPKAVYWKNSQPVTSSNKFKCTIIKVL